MGLPSGISVVFRISRGDAVVFPRDVLGGSRELAHELAIIPSAHGTYV